MLETGGMFVSGRKVERKVGNGKRMSLKAASALEPNEWVVFVEPRLDDKTSAFVDGRVAFPFRDQKDAYRRSARLAGGRAKFFTGTIPYRRVSLNHKDAVGEQVA